MVWFGTTACKWRCKIFPLKISCLSLHHILMLFNHSTLNFSFWIVSLSGILLEYFSWVVDVFENEIRENPCRFFMILLSFLPSHLPEKCWSLCALKFGTGLEKGELQRGRLGRWWAGGSTYEPGTPLVWSCLRLPHCKALLTHVQAETW